MSSRESIPHRVLALVAVAGSSRAALRRVALLALAFATFLSASTPAIAQSQQILSAPVVRGAESMPPVPAHFADIDLRNLPIRQSWRAGDGIKFIPKRFYLTPKLADAQARAEKPTGKYEDPLLQVQAQTPALKNFSVPLLNFGGGGFTGVAPPDTVGDVGGVYYIQSTNASGGSTFRIFDKQTGALTVGPLTMDSLGAQAPGITNCSKGAGDPIVLYDRLASRWLFSEFSDLGNKLCVYISATNDPVSGGWYAYEFAAPSFPDYPKYGVWHDAYYIGTNEGSGPGVYAIDRTSMLAGQSASMQRFSAPSLAGFGFQMITPADLDGPNAPPANTPNFFVRHNDDESHAPGNTNNPTTDYLEIFEFHVDFANANNSSFTGPVQIPIAEFDSDLCGLSSFVCIPQPQGGIGLDPLREVSMFRVQYRNTGNSEILVGSHVTDVDNTDHAGVRWWQLIRSGGGSWSLDQEGTYAPDGHSRWMSSAATDGDGNLAVGYSTGSASLSAGIRYNGRLQGDPPGTLTQGETTIFAGAGTQSNERWGDYSSLNVDPVDDCTFWYTNEYATSGGSWSTRIGKFKFDGCGTPGVVLSASNPQQSTCSPGNATPIVLSVTSSGGFTGPTNLSFPYLPPGFSGAFSPGTITPPGDSTINLSTAVGTTYKTHAIELLASPIGADPVSLTANIRVFSVVPDTPDLVVPVDGGTSIPPSTYFSWAPSYQAESYLLEVDDDPAFGSIELTASGTGTFHIANPELQGDTNYYWRVTSINPCGNTTGPVRSFTTSAADLFCSSPALAIPDGVLSADDNLVIAQAGAITEIDMSLDVTHTFVGDLRFTLTHQDTGTSAILVNRPGKPALGNYGCSGENIIATLSDSATLAIEDECLTTIPAIAGVLLPNNPLSVFAGEDLAGTWTLTSEDLAGADTGTLNEWCLAATQVPEPGSALLFTSGILFIFAEQTLRGRRRRSKERSGIR